MTNKRLLIDATHAEETRVTIADETRIYEFDISAASKTQNKGNIYLAKVTRVEPSLQAAFVEYGGDRQGFLPFSEIHPDYYQIPVADREKLLEEVEAEEAQAEEDEEKEASGNGRGRGRRRGRRNGRHTRDNQADESDAGEETFNDEVTVAIDGAEEIASAADTAPVETTTSDVTVADAQVGDAQTDTVTVEVTDEKSEKTTTKAASKTSAVAKSDIVDDGAAQENISPAVAEDVSEETGQDENGNSDDDDAQDPAEEEKSEVESLGDDEEFTRRRKASFLRRYKIQEVIKRNQVMLVQVIKEERGNKGASLSTYISLAGRYCVLMPNSPKTGGISRKISNSEDRKRLKAISEEIRSSNGMSAIIRTAGIDRTRAEIKRDYDYLIKLWSQIRELTLSSTAPAIVHEEADIVKRSLRDLYSSDIKEVVVAGEEAYKRAKEFMKLMMPSHAARVKLHHDNTPIFYAYDVEDQLLRMHEPQVKLESGGSIVLNPTEALVAIDVNSGRSTTERNVEETALKTNLEAAQEVARQVRLRDLAGLIVIDFIDMFDYKHRRAVERQLKEALKSDRAKIQVGRISAFGLLEMSRQRLRPSFAETSTQECPHCEGRGIVLNPGAHGIQMLRFLEKEASSGDYAHLKLKVSPAVALYLLNQKRNTLTELEKTHGLNITIEIGENLKSAASFMLERYTAEGQKTDVNGMDGIPSSGKRNRNRKRKRGGNDNASPRQHDENSTASADEDSQSEDVTQNDTQSPDEEQSDSRRRRRRGGRRRGGRGRARNSDERTGNEHTGDERGNDDNYAAREEQDDTANTVDKPTTTQESGDATPPEATSKPVVTDGEKKSSRRRGGRRKSESAKEDSSAPAKADNAAAVKAPVAPSAEKPVEKTVEKPVENSAAKTAETPLEKTLESVGASENHGGTEKAGSTRKGWWRRIVE